MSRRELTPDERDSLTEDELVEYDVRHVQRGLGVSQDALRRLVRAHVRIERQKRAEDKRITSLAWEAGTTERAIRRAEAEQAAKDAERRADRELAIARRAVAPRGRGRGPEPIVSEEDVRRVWDELGDSASYGTAAKRLGVHESTIRRRLGKL